MGEFEDVRVLGLPPVGPVPSLGALSVEVRV